MKTYDRDVFFQASVAHQCHILSYKKKRVAEMIGLPLSTFYAKMKQPGRFTVSEMRDLCNVLRFTVDDKTSIL